MAAAAALKPQVMVLPFPAQGHVMPLMQLSYRLADQGVEVHFANTDFNHARILEAMAREAAVPQGIHLVSFPDGMGPDGDRTDVGKLAAGLPAAMLGGLEALILSNKINWVVADVSMSWALQLAGTAGVRVALFSTFSAAVFALRMHVPRIIQDGIIDECGNVKREERIQLSPKMPAIAAAELPWVTMGKSPESRRAFIKGVIKVNPVIAQADAIICNTFQEAESEALASLPMPALAIGPLGAPSGSMSMAACHFWAEDRTCLSWLDAQAHGSVVYVAFGSMAVFDPAQLQELADGLALSGRPFLWVVRPNIIRDSEAEGGGGGGLDELRRRAGGRGLVVSWAPQQRVLAHPAVACFVTHCGWNSTMEGVRYGVPLLCWPYFADQFCNRSYVCDVWGTGMRLDVAAKAEEMIGGVIVTKEEICNKVTRLIQDDGIKARALSMKTAATDSIADGGSSHQDLIKLVNLFGQN